MRILDKNSGAVLAEGNAGEIMKPGETYREVVLETPKLDPGADLRGVRFERANLLSVEMREADLRGATFYEVEVLGDLTEANLEGAILGPCELQGTFAHIRAAAVPFSQLRAKLADFRGAQLRGAAFDRASFSNCDFRGADLTGADLRTSTAEGIFDLTGATIDGARWNWAVHSFIGEVLAHQATDDATRAWMFWIARSTPAEHCADLWTPGKSPYGDEVLRWGLSQIGDLIQLGDPIPPEALDILIDWVPRPDLKELRHAR